MGKVALLIISVLLTPFKKVDNISIDKNEALKAFVLLNDIRTNPSKYYTQLEFLKTTKIKSTKLNWNNKLAKVAEKKAFDMASKNYFEHIDQKGCGINYKIKKSGYKLNSEWVKDKRSNYFESIAANPEDGESAIYMLLIDEGFSSLGHRKHLLGIDKWNASLVDIGIGFVRRDSGSDYQTYVSVIIAKHN